MNLKETDMGNIKQQDIESPTLDAQPQEEDRPMRKAFSDRFAKRHKDIDFEDKEARYAAMNDDADVLSSYEESGRALSDAFDKNRWLAAMMMDLKDNPDMSPIEWMASQGIDIQTALDDEETRKKVAQQIADFQEKKAQEEGHEQEVMANLRKSADAMEPLGLPEDERIDLWDKFFKIVSDAEDGLVSPETWKMFRNAQSYDDDVASAREEGAMNARNEKIQNNLRKSEPSIPPTLGTSGGNATPKKKKKSGGFFEGITY